VGINLSPNSSPPLPNPPLVGEGRGAALLLRGENNSPIPTPPYPPLVGEGKGKTFVLGMGVRGVR